MGHTRLVVDRTYWVSGAQPADVLVHVLERAWAEPSALVTVDDGAAAAADRTAAQSEPSRSAPGTNG
jgi:hypothetical protein